MKKLPLSVISSLVLLFATGSAFTTKHHKKVPLLHEVWGVTPGDVSTQYPGPSIANLACSIEEVLYSRTISLAAAGYGGLQEFRSNFPNGDLACYLNTNYVCMAYVKYDVNYPLSGLVLALLEGEYDHIEE